METENALTEERLLQILDERETKQKKITAKDKGNTLTFTMSRTTRYLLVFAVMVIYVVVVYYMDPNDEDEGK